MNKPLHPWSDVWLPIVVSLGTFCTLNFLWAFFGLWEYVATALSVYMVSSLVALALLARAIRRGTLTLGDIGLAREGWHPWRRFTGWALIVLLPLYLYLAPDPTVKTPLTIGDYCFWFYFLLCSSLAEMLLFACLAYCLTEKWLAGHGLARWATILLAGLFSGVTFGWHHYTGEKEVWQWSWVTIPVMWINLAYFIPSRNFHLMVLLHNAIAAVGFTQAQHSHDPVRDSQNPLTFKTPYYTFALIVSFALPFVLLHALEWWAQQASRGRQPPVSRGDGPTTHILPHASSETAG